MAATRVRGAGGGGGTSMSRPSSTKLPSSAVIGRRIWARYFVPATNGNCGVKRSAFPTISYRPAIAGSTIVFCSFTRCTCSARQCGSSVGNFASAVRSGSPSFTSTATGRLLLSVIARTSGSARATGTGASNRTMTAGARRTFHMIGWLARSAGTLVWSRRI